MWKLHSRLQSANYYRDQEIRKEIQLFWPITCFSQRPITVILCQIPCKVTSNRFVLCILNLGGDCGWTVIANPNKRGCVVTVHTHSCVILDNNDTAVSVESYNVTVRDILIIAGGWCPNARITETWKHPWFPVESKSHEEFGGIQAWAQPITNAIVCVEVGSRGIIQGCVFSSLRLPWAMVIVGHYIHPVQVRVDGRNVVWLILFVD